MDVVGMGDVPDLEAIGISEKQTETPIITRKQGSSTEVNIAQYNFLSGSQPLSLAPLHTRAFLGP